jgi:C-methyltransferase
MMGLWKAGAVKAAIELDFFTHIAKGNTTAAAVARAARASERGTVSLLNVLCVLGLLSKKNEEYELSPEAHTYLSHTSPVFVEDLIFAVASPWEWDAFGHLSDAVKSGKATIYPYMKGEESLCLERMVLGIGTLASSSAEQICDLLGIGQSPRDSLKVLDIACGTGIYGFTMAKREQKARVSAVDRRQIIRFAQDVAAKMGVIERIVFKPGNIFSVPFEDDSYDLVLIGNVLHQYGRDRVKKLMARAFRAAKPHGGMIVIHDFVADDARTKETACLVMSLDMLLYTDDGDVHTYSEYKTWLGEAGFSDVSAPVAVPCNLTSIITAKKYGKSEDLD